MNLTLNIIGAGKLGKTLGYLLAQNTTITLSGVCNTTLASSQEAVNILGSGKAYPSIQALPPADLTLIATPDSLIEKVANELSQQTNLAPQSIVFHCSGALSSEILSSLRLFGCAIASVHPMKSFVNTALANQNLAGIYCALEGDTSALAILSPLFTSLGAIPFAISNQAKGLYHAAAVFASNYLVTLGHQASLCLQGAGVTPELVMPIILHLMQSSLNNLKQTLSFNQALTGPLQRGDLSTLQKNLQALTNKEQQQLYALLGKATLPLTTLDDDQYEKILQFLSSALSS